VDGIFRSLGFSLYCFGFSLDPAISIDANGDLQNESVCYRVRKISIAG